MSFHNGGTVITLLEVGVYVGMGIQVEEWCECQ